MREQAEKIRRRVSQPDTEMKFLHRFNGKAVYCLVAGDDLCRIFDVLERLGIKRSRFRIDEPAKAEDKMLGEHRVSI